GLLRHASGSSPDADRMGARARHAAGALAGDQARGGIGRKGGVSTKRRSKCTTCEAWPNLTVMREPFPPRRAPSDDFHFLPDFLWQAPVFPLPERFIAQDVLPRGPSVDRLAGHDRGGCRRGTECVVLGELVMRARIAQYASIDELGPRGSVGAQQRVRLGLPGSCS